MAGFTYVKFKLKLKCKFLFRLTIDFIQELILSSVNLRKIAKEVFGFHPPNQKLTEYSCQFVLFRTRYVAKNIPFEKQRFSHN